MTPQQLLIPRYEVIADWPKSKNVLVEVGDIFTSNTFMPEMFYCVGKSGLCLEDDLKKYPHLFKPLPWYHGRKIEEMPEYIKWPNGDIEKVSFTETDCIGSDGKKFRMIESILPALESDYITFINREK